MHENHETIAGACCPSWRTKDVSFIRRRFLTGAALSGIGSICALAIDMPVARWADGNGFRGLGFLDRLVTWSELFAHGVGVGILILIAYVLDPTCRRRMLRVSVLSIGAGIASDCIKLFIKRSRPRVTLLDGVSVNTFLGYFPPISDHSLQSFPSSHSATAVGFAIGLSWLYPRGNWLFYVVALIAMSQRWANRDHYVSDSCAGAVVAMTIAAFTLGKSPLQRKLDCFESRIATPATEGIHRM